jgi:arylsulfatase A-like enzyme
MRINRQEAFMLRTLSVLSLCNVVVSCFATVSFTPTRQPVKPNVVIVLTDDQGYGDLSCTGNPILKTPNMDRLAAEGVRFVNFHVDTYCTPTRSALMTGHYSYRAGGWGTTSGRNMLRDDETTMPEVFHHNGYRTGVFGKWHLGANYPYRPIDRGFDEWLGHGNGGTGCAGDWWGNDRVNDRYIHNGKWEDTPRPGYEGDVFFDAAMQFIRDTRDRPFFVYLSPYNPHDPWSIGEKAWAEPYLGKVPTRTAYFYASIARTDWNLGRLRDFLAKEGLADNTILIFLADNGSSGGYQVFNAGMRGHKGETYDGGHRVPCFLRWPGGGYGKPVEIRRLAAHLDLLPTLVDLCKLELPKPVRFDGASLKPLMDNPKADWPERNLVVCEPQNGGGPVPAKIAVGYSAVMTDRWRLVNGGELYDMENDPGQKQNVAKANPTVVQQLSDVYAVYQADVTASTKGWQGRVVIGTASELETELAAEDITTDAGFAPWSQAAVARGNAAAGHWPVRFAQSGAYHFEIRRWPRELDTAMCGVPANTKVPDAWLDGERIRETLYPAEPKALPIAKVSLRVGENVQEITVSATDKSASFTMKVEAGPAEIRAAFLDSDGKSVGAAYYLYIRHSLVAL